MDKKTITIAVIILVLVVIGAVYFWLGAEIGRAHV